jgi:hypothetical protein
MCSCSVSLLLFPRAITKSIELRHRTQHDPNGQIEGNPRVATISRLYLVLADLIKQGD